MENINFKASILAPNPLEVKYWIDMNADPQGGIIKYYDFGTKHWNKLKAESEPVDLSGIIADVTSLKNNKVDKVSGKVLSTHDYTTAEKTKLESLVNYNDSSIRGLITSLTARVVALETPTP